MFNTKEFAWKDISFVFLGRKVKGVTNIRYEESAESEYVRGTGSKALSINTGNEAVSGEITLLQSEIRALNNLAKAEGFSSFIQAPQFDITVKYQQKNGADIEIDIIKTVQPERITKEMRQGAMFQEIPIAFKAIEVLPNVTL